MTSQPSATLDLKIEPLMLRTMTDQAAAIQGDKWARFIDDVLGKSFPAIGMIAAEFFTRNLWNQLADPATGKTYAGYTAWAKSALPCSWSTVCAAKKCFESLSASGVPAEKILEMKPANMKLLVNEVSSESVRREPKVVEAAIHENGNGFRKKMIEEHPEQHIEDVEWITVKPTLSQCDRWTEIMEKFGWQSWVEAIDIAFEEYDQTHEVAE
jgi:hypothetical protein